MVSAYPVMREDAEQRPPALRERFNGLRSMIFYGIIWRAMPNDLPPWSAVYQQFRCRMEAGCFDALGHLLALHVTPASRDNRAEMGRLVAAVQDATDESVELAYVNQGYTSEKPARTDRHSGFSFCGDVQFNHCLRPSGGCYIKPAL